jgi:regulator of protease activity HflC (stomatin/prohibitin superfamily)
MDSEYFFPKLIAGAFAGLLFLVFAFSSFYTISQGDRGVVTHYGAVVAEAEPGLGFKMPFVTGIHEISVQTQRDRFANMGQGQDYRLQAYSKDQQPATVSLSVNYHALDVSKVFAAYGDLEGIQSKVLDSKTIEIFKNVFGQFDAADAIQHRAVLNAQVTAALVGAFKGAPFAIDSVQIEDITFSQQYENAVEARMQAIVQQQQAEAQKAKRIIDADAAKYEREADADASAYVGQKEAEAIKAKGDALRQSPEIVALTAAQKWNGELPTTMVPNAALPFLSIGK